MDTKDIKQIDDQGMAAWSNHDPEAFANLFAENFSWIDSTSPNPIQTKEGAREYVKAWLTAFPDMGIKQVRRIIDNGWLAAEVEFTGTNTGTLIMGDKQIPPTGKQVKGKGVYFAHIDNGKTIEFRSFPDIAGMMMQLGLM